MVFVNNYKFLAFKQKLEFWKTSICLCEFDSFPILKDLSDEIIGDTSKCDFLI